MLYVIILYILFYVTIFKYSFLMLLFYVIIFYHFSCYNFCYNFCKNFLLFKFPEKHDTLYFVSHTFSPPSTPSFSSSSLHSNCLAGLLLTDCLGALLPASHFHRLAAILICSTVWSPAAKLFFSTFWRSDNSVVLCHFLTVWQYFACNVSNILTEDQCNWLNTKRFILLKERKQ